MHLANYLDVIRDHMVECGMVKTAVDEHTDPANKDRHIDSGYSTGEVRVKFFTQRPGKPVIMNIHKATDIHPVLIAITHFMGRGPS